MQWMTNKKTIKSLSSLLIFVTLWIKKSTLLQFCWDKINIKILLEQSNGRRFPGSKVMFRYEISRKLYLALSWPQFWTFVVLKPERWIYSLKSQDDNGISYIYRD